MIVNKRTHKVGDVEHTPCRYSILNAKEIPGTIKDSNNVY